MTILGINGRYMGADHDASAALIGTDGVVLGAVEEERLRRIKRAPNCYPTASVREVLDMAGIEPQDVDCVALPWLPEPGGYRRDVVEAEVRATMVDPLGLRPDVSIRFVGHHESHAWAGLAYVPPAHREGCDVIALDGCGECTSGAGFTLEQGLLRTRWHLGLEGSLGIFYEAVTKAVGFAYGEEGKAMGLASYGTPGSVRVSAPPDARWESGWGAPIHDDLYGEVLARRLSELRHTAGAHRTFMHRAHVAASAQGELIGRLLTYVDETSSQYVVLSGGTALNCSANGVLADTLARQGRHLSFHRLRVIPASP